MKVVVTGSRSFIGSALKRLCEVRGVGWAGVDVAGPPSREEQVVDIQSPQLAEVIPGDAQAIVHLAALSRDQDCRGQLERALAVNVGGTLNVLAAARARRIPQLIFASTEWVYGEVANGATQTEDQPIDVTRLSSEYAFSKLVAEQALRLAWQADGPAVTVLRFGIVYGPRPAHWSAVESLVHAVRTQGEVTVGCLGTARRFIHVEDVASGILAAVGRRGYEVFNLSGDGLVSLGDILEVSRQLLGWQPRVVERQPGKPSIRNPDNTKARRELGWQPQIGLTEGVRMFLSASARTAGVR